MDKNELTTKITKKEPILLLSEKEQYPQSFKLKKKIV